MAKSDKLNIRRTNFTDTQLIQDIQKYAGDSQGDKAKEAKEYLKLNKKVLDELNEYDKHLKHQANREQLEEEKRIIKDAHEFKLKKLKEEGKVVQAIQEEMFDSFDKTLSTLGKVSDNLSRGLDSIMGSYLDRQQNMTAHLIGTTEDNASSFKKLSDTISATLGLSGVVKQEAVYNKLYELVNKGIVYNVEQRAFLQTISDDMGMIFDATDGSLTRLIRLQTEDISSNRIALELSLQEFLNQNYATSEYIRDSFRAVSSSLLEAQSLMSAQQGMELESSIQSWLGSYFSAGASSNTVQSLASALNALGSGDISNLGSGISNLVLMGVAKAGEDYGKLLNEGITATDVDLIMQGITSYLGDMGANSSNVVKSQLSQLFGVNVSDIAAIANLKTPVGSVSNNFGDVFSQANDFIPASKQISNIFSNALYTWGTNMADDQGTYLAYRTTKLIGDSLGTILDGVSIGGSFGLPQVDLGKLAKAAPMIPLLIGLIESVPDYISSNKTSLTSISGIFEALGGNSVGTNVQISSAGTSGSAYVGQGTQNPLEVADNIQSEVVQGDKKSSEDNIDIIANNSTMILDILDTYMSTISDTLANIEISSRYSSSSSFGSSPTGI